MKRHPQLALIACHEYPNGSVLNEYRVGGWVAEVKITSHGCQLVTDSEAAQTAVRRRAAMDLESRYGPLGPRRLVAR